MSEIKPFSRPVYITRPLLPELKDVGEMLENIWESGYLTNNGETVRQLELELERFLRVKHLCVFSNGTAALQIACRVLGLSGEVITTPFTFAATAHCLSWCNLKPVFCDICDTDMNMDPGRLEELITPDTSAILPVHVFGYPCRVDEIARIADKHGLKVIYDAAHAFGVETGGRPVGSYGDISMFSFHATKVFHTVEGGALSCGSPWLKERAGLLRNFGIYNEECVLEPGTNAKLSELHAAVGLLVLRLVEEEIKKRKLLTNIYRSMLGGIPGLRFGDDRKGVVHNYSYFVIRVDAGDFGMTRDRLSERLKEYNVFTRKYFYPLCSQFQCYRSLPSSDPGHLPVANKAAREVLTLPLYGEMSEEDAVRICRIISYIRLNNTEVQHG
jgi:dTDP-4-amino-4,6-dideoxygalactose transaminase